MKKNIIILGIIVVLMSGICFADSFVNDSETKFDLGVYNWTAWKISDVLLSGELPDAGVNSAVDTTGLVGLWHMNDKVEDSSGDNHGNAQGGADTVARQIGMAGIFDGLDDYVDCGNPNSLQITGNLTISAWIKASASAGIQGYKIVAKDDVTNRDYFLAINSANNPYFGIFRSNSFYSVGSGTTDVSDGGWYHLVGVNDGTDIKIYVNGVLKDTNSGNGGAIDNDAVNLEIGRLGSGVAYFKGSIDEVAIYNRALTAEEINQTYQRGLAGQSNDITDDRVAFYKMDEPSWTKVQDTSGNDNDGTINGPVWATGKLDTAMSFDGVDDYVVVSDQNEFNDDFTIITWINTKGGRGNIVAKHKSSTEEEFLFLLNESNNLQFLTQPACGGGWDSFGSSSVISNNTWHHVAIVLDRGNHKELFIDGISVSSSETVTSPPDCGIDTYIGIKERDYADPFNGAIDEVSIWNRSLSASEILAHYNAQKDNYPSSGDYESKVFDAISSVSWQNITFDWNFNGNLVGKELPDNQGIESGEYGVNMSGNILLMHMDETTGVIEDTSGNGNNGTAVGGVTFNVSGKFDTAFGFDGVDGYVYVDNFPEIESITSSINFTLSFWLKTNQNGDNYSLSPMLIEKREIVFWGDRVFQFSFNSNGKATFGFSEQDTQTHYDAVSSKIVNDNTWHFITGRKSGNVYEIYVDGIYESYLTGQGGQSSNDGITIGARRLDTGVGSAFFNGSIDEVAIYNRALSPEEILDHYKRGALRLNISAKSCDDASCSGETTWDKTCTSSPCDISTLTNNQYIQYKVNMQSDGSSTPELSSVSVFYGTGAVGCIDNDNDGWGDTGSNLSLCNYTASYDCNDGNADINPNAYDIPNNGIDEDCSGDDAYASYEAKVYFMGETGFSGLGYYIGDDVYYEVNFFKNNVSSDEDVVNIVVNLTDVWGNVLKSQTISDMEHSNTGNWTGMFITHDISSQDDNKVNLKIYVYNSGGTLLDWRTHGDEWFVTGTVPSFISTAYTYFTNAISNHTVKDLAVNSSEAKIDWSGSTLDLHARAVDLDSAITIGDRSAYINSTTYSELNNSATLTFYNINCSSPYVFYSETAATRDTIFAENNQCLAPQCTNIQCIGTTLTVDVLSFSGYAAEADVSLTIDADDPKFVGAEVHFTADYRNLTDDSFITGATCTIYFTDGNYPMDEGTIYTYNRTFVTEGLKDYNVTCSKAGFSTLTAFDNATIVSAEIPEFSIMTLGIGLIVVLAGLFIIRRKRE